MGATASGKWCKRARLAWHSTQGEIDIDEFFESIDEAHTSFTEACLTQISAVARAQRSPRQFCERSLCRSQTTRSPTYTSSLLQS